MYQIVALPDDDMKGRRFEFPEVDFLEKVKKIVRKINTDWCMISISMDPSMLLGCRVSIS